MKRRLLGLLASVLVGTAFLLGLCSPNSRAWPEQGGKAQQHRNQQPKQAPLHWGMASRMAAAARSVTPGLPRVWRSRW